MGSRARRVTVMLSTAAIVAGASMSLVSALDTTGAPSDENSVIENSVTDNGAITEIAGPAEASSATPDELILDRLIVEYRQGTSETQQASIRNRRAADAEQVEEILPAADALDFDDTVAAQQAKTRLESDRRVARVSYDVEVGLAATPNDPYFADQWHLTKVNAPAAWDRARGTGITIAVLDTGIDTGHPDLAGKLVDGWNVQNNNNDVHDIDTALPNHYGHGTGTAGTAAAITNNASGVAGLAWDAKIMPIQVSRLENGEPRAATSMIDAGLRWAADHGARVANVSWSVGPNPASIKGGIDYFTARGGVVVIAAGNDGASHNFGDEPNALVVGSTNENDGRSTFSNVGPFVDLAAPGENILAPIVRQPAGNYAGWTGTSFAAPLVAGAAAIVMSAKPGISPFEVMQALKSTAVDLGAPGRDNEYGAGRLDVARAVAAVAPVVDGPLGVVNGASYTAPVTPEGIAAAFGSQLATTTQAGTDIDPAPGIQLPTNLGGSTARVRDAAGTERLAPLFYVSPAQVNLQIPAGTVSGTATVTILSSSGTRSTGTVNVAPVAPALFSASADGRGAAVGQAVLALANGSQSTTDLSAPVPFGAATDQVYLVLYGTGVRARVVNGSASATIDGVPVAVAYAGAQPTYVGLDQINIGPLPRSLAGRGTVNVSITIDGRTSNALQVRL